jgi:hypothetical protein
MKRLTLFVMCVFLSCSALSFNAFAQGKAATGGAKKPAVLFVADRGQAKTQFLRTWHDWLESGYNIDVKAIPQVKSLEDLSAFNTVVVNFLPFVDANKKVTADQLQFEKVLAQYMKQGGGVLVFCGGGQYGRMKPAVDHLLKPYGAMVPEEQIVDKTNIIGYCHEGRFLCNSTTQIEKAPMTRGIKSIGYVGQASRADVMKLMMPLVIKDKAAWKVVLRGEKEAYSAAGKHPGDGPEIKDTPDTYAEYPVMAAYRSVGKGRLFVFPHNVCQTVASPDIFDNLFWQVDDIKDDKVQDNRTFIMQTVDWAAEPSLKKGNFGGFKTNPNLNPFAGAILSRKDKPAIDWTRIKPIAKLAPKMSSIRGIIGAQSTYSGGKHTVKQLADAARKAGLDFIVFTAKLEELTPDKWTKLIEDCERLTNEKFAAFPGLWALDKVGNRFFGIGKTPYPTPTAVTKDGKRLDNLAQFWFKLYGRRMVGFANVNQNPNPWFELRKASGMALYTYEGGKRVDKAVQAFCTSAFNMENYLPFSVAVVTTPEEVKAASKEMVNVFTGGNLQDLNDYIYGKNKKFKGNMFWETPHYWNLSSGPKMEYHGHYNASTLVTDEENENLYRYGFKFSNLKKGDEIFLMDGPEVFRKWIANGPTFAMEKTWAHEQVRVFILKVVRGGEPVFVSTSIKHNYGRRFYSCGDRQNSLPVNFQPDKKGDWYVSGVPLAAAYKSWDPNTLVYSPEPIYLIGAVGIEAMPKYISSWTTGPQIPFDHPRLERAKSLSSTHFHRLSCPGVIITDNIAKRVYPDGSSHKGDQRPPLKTIPLELFNYTVRHYGLYAMQGQLNAQVTESKITALQDVSMKPGKNKVMVAYHNHPIRPNVNYYAESQLDGKTNVYKVDKEYKRFDSKLTQGDYVGIYPSGRNRGGAHFAVSGDLSSTLHINKGRVSSYLNLNVPSNWKKGQEFDYSVLFTNGGSTPIQEESDYAKFKDFLGFNGPHPAIKDVTGGELLAKPVIATIQTTTESVVRLNTIKNEEDPIGLTIRMAGFNPKWQTVYRLNGSKKWRFLGELDGYFYLNLYTHMQAHTVMAGHPVFADNDDVIVALEDPKGKQSAFEVYNPTDKAITVTLRANPEFYKPWNKKVQVKPFESKRVKVTSKPVN